MSDVRAGRGQQGFSLIELMVAAVIAMVVMGVVASLYMASRNIFRFQESNSRLQEAGRYVLDTIGRDVRDAAYMGCGGLSMMTNIVTTNDSATAPYYWWLDTDRLVWGYDQAAASLPTELSGVRSDSDALVIMHRAVANENLITGHDLANKRFTLSQNHTYAKGTVLIATDCQRTSLFRMSNSSAAPTAQVEYASSVLTDGKDNLATVTLSPTAYLSGGFISPLVTNAYYVMNSNDAAFATNPCPSDDASWVRPVLVVRTLAGATNATLLAPQPVACDVMTIQMRYGVDNDGDLSADEWMKAGDIGTNKTIWGNVVSVRLDFLVVNPKANTLAGNQDTYCLDYKGGSDPASCTTAAYGYLWTSDASTGKRSAKVFSTTFGLRNRAS